MELNDEKVVPDVSEPEETKEVVKSQPETKVAAADTPLEPKKKGNIFQSIAQLFTSK